MLQITFQPRKNRIISSVLEFKTAGLPGYGAANFIFQLIFVGISNFNKKNFDEMG